MLSKSPEDRPQSARDVLNRLTGSTSCSIDRGAMAATVVDTSPPTRPSPADPAVSARAVGTPATAVVARPRDPGRRCGHGSGRGSCLRGRDDSPNSDRQSVRTIGAATTPTVAMARSSTPSTSAPTPTPAKARPSEPAPSSPTSAAPSRQTARANRTADSGREQREPSLQQTLSNLRAAVHDVSSSGQIDPKKAEELSKRVDVLTSSSRRSAVRTRPRRSTRWTRTLPGSPRSVS